MPKPNLASIMSQSAQKSAEQPKTTQTRKSTKAAPVAPSRQGKRGIVAYVDPLAIRELKILSADKDLSMQDLFIEAINDLLIKHGKKPIA